MFIFLPSFSFFFSFFNELLTDEFFLIDPNFKILESKFGETLTYLFSYQIQSIRLIYVAAVAPVF